MSWVCPVCDGKHSKHLPMKFGLPLKQCTACSLIYLNQSESLVDYFDETEKEFFSEGYLRRRRGPFSEQFLIHKAKRRIKVIKKYKTSGRLLDIGCGSGELIYIANLLGYEAEGIEYSKPLAEFVHKKYGASVYCGQLESVDLPHKYDIVVMSHVLEHTIDPLATLQNIQNVLNPGGILYVAVPNIDCWESRFRGWGSYEPYHLWYFNPNTLSRLLEKVEYYIVDIHTWEPYSAWLNTIIRSILHRQHAVARSAVHHDSGGRLRYLFLTLMGLLNTARFVSGLLLTPLRKFQEATYKGEELIAIAVRKDKSPATKQ